MTVKAPTIVGICAMLLILTDPSMQDSTTLMNDADFTKSSENFAFRLASQLVKPNEKKNIIFSPFSIQTCLSMARMGATGQTAAEMDKGLGFPAVKEETLADKYFAILSQYANSNILKIANKIYVMKNYEVLTKFNDLLTQKFFSKAENIDFAQNTQAANNINSWVETKTNHLIKNLISPDLLNKDTRMVLLNAIHFKGEWVNSFPERNTKDKDFYLDEQNKVKVKMMHVRSRFRYGEFAELDATALEMRYKDSDLSMLVLLPKSRTGLAKLEEKLKSVSLNELAQKMYTTDVIVDFPKFKTEFNVELSGVLQQLGMARMFSREAEFGNMLNTTERLAVSKVIHKAFIDVNEKGTEAAAATGITMKSRGRSAQPRPPPPKIFNTDHPFYYFIRNINGINMFQGSQLSFN
ncbi:antitrypsin isoform X1 [Stomoxys calcitrans]|uniref:antitrypsin isoform X1 n=1 Tax=Stomoxys calcitrans TaxID=35570 RepID=UPI0027E2EFF7|nr:antitrypsin isoform X1 [Stomoxys calcitrans]